MILPPASLRRLFTVMTVAAFVPVVRSSAAEPPANSRPRLCILTDIGGDPYAPTGPGWAGRYQREPDGWYRDLPITDDFDPRTTISDHRPAFRADFARSMAWCQPGTQATANP